MLSHGSLRTSLACSASLASSGWPRARVASAALAALIGLALADANAGGPLYQWTDAQGNVHYTPDPDLVPSGQRGNLVIIEPASPPTRAPARPTLAPMPPSEPRAAAPATVAQPIAEPPVVEAPTPPGAAPEAPAAAPPPVEAPRAAAPALEPPPLLAPPSDASPAEAPPRTAPQSAIESAGATSAAVAPTRAVEATPEHVQPPVATPAAPPPADVALLEQQLKAAIAADQETLKSLLAAPTEPGATGLVDSTELRAIARRLPELQAQLRALREQPAPPTGP